MGFTSSVILSAGAAGLALLLAPLLAPDPTMKVVYEVLLLNMVPTDLDLQWAFAGVGRLLLPAFARWRRVSCSWPWCGFSSTGRRM